MHSTLCASTQHDIKTFVLHGMAYSEYLNILISHKMKIFHKIKAFLNCLKN